MLALFTMQDAALFSLGGAVWGFQPAVGYYSPQQQVPEAWLLVLVEHFADAEFYLCLFRASRGARDWVLETAPTARYSLVSSDVDMWQHQLSTLRERLQTRGSKPVRLRVPASQQHAAALAALPGVLAGVGACITELTLRGPDRTPQQPVHPIAVEHAAAAFLRAVAPHLPNLSTLTLTNIPCELPSPSVLPQLKDLSMDQLQPNRIIGRSVVRLFTQLTALALQHAEAAESAVPALLRLCQPSNTTTTLVRLSIHAPLTDELLACLLISAPCLTELSVGKKSQAPRTPLVMYRVLARLFSADIELCGTHLLIVFALSRLRDSHHVICSYFMYSCCLFMYTQVMLPSEAAVIAQPCGQCRSCACGPRQATYSCTHSRACLGVSKAKSYSVI